MKISNRFFVLLLHTTVLLLFTYASCNRENEGPGGSGVQPEVRPRGEVVGNPVTKTIGSTGGELMSGDGKLLVKIPAGAVTSPTVLTIQPITNTLPGAQLNAYRLLPEGAAFVKPVELVYSYKNEGGRGREWGRAHGLLAIRGLPRCLLTLSKRNGIGGVAHDQHGIGCFDPRMRLAR